MSININCLTVGMSMRMFRVLEHECETRTKIIEELQVEIQKLKLELKEKEKP